MAYDYGSIVVISDPYKDGNRPVLVVSNDDRPYQGNQYTICIISRTQRDQAVELGASDLIEGQLHHHPSYANVWSLHEFDHPDIIKRIGQVSRSKMLDVASGIFNVTKPV